MEEEENVLTKGGYFLNGGKGGGGVNTICLPCSGIYGTINNAKKKWDYSIY